MGSSKPKLASKLFDDANQDPGRPWRRSDVGLVLLDSSLTPIGFNVEAMAILSYPSVPATQQPKLPRIPEEILEAIRTRDAAQHLIADTYFNAGRREYVCQALPLTSIETSPPRAIVALLLRRKSSATQAINEVAGDFRLTERERQALSGICLGLSSKDLAKRMNVSPNTIKSFLRIIMVKMGVTTRAAVVAKILERNAGGGGQPAPAREPVQRSASVGA